MEFEEALKELGIDSVYFQSFMSNRQIETMLDREDIINHLCPPQKLGM